MLYHTEKVTMTDADRQALSAEHVSATLELERVKEEKADVSRVYRVKVRTLEEKILKLATQLDEGVFERKFEVIEEPDDERQMIDIKRADTGERVNTRPMTEVEKEAARKRKQTEMFEEDEDGESKPARKAKPKGKNGKR